MRGGWSARARGELTFIWCQKSCSGRIVSVLLRCRGLWQGLTFRPTLRRLPRVLVMVDMVAGIGSIDRGGMLCGSIRNSRTPTPARLMHRGR